MNCYYDDNEEVGIVGTFSVLRSIYEESEVMKTPNQNPLALLYEAVGVSRKMCETPKKYFM